jgi:hypothetical protein
LDSHWPRATATAKPTATGILMLTEKEKGSRKATGFQKPTDLDSGLLMANLIGKQHRLIHRLRHLSQYPILPLLPR